MTFIYCLSVILIPLFIIPEVLENAYEAPKDVLIFALTGLTLLAIAKRKEFKCSLTNWLVALVLLFGFSLTYGENPSYAFRTIVMWLCGVILFIGISQLRFRERLILAKMIVLGGLFVTAETWLELGGKSFLLPYIGLKTGLTSTIGNSNYLGAYLLAPCLISLGIPGKAYKGAFLAILSGILIARARSSWIGLGVGLLVFGWAYYRIGGLQRVKTGVFIGVIVTLGLALNLSGVLSFKSAMQPDTLKLRVKYGRGAVEMIKEAPFLGHGVASYRNGIYEAQGTIEKAHPGFFKDYPEPKPRRAHNEYLEVLVSFGLVGFVLIIAIGVILFRHGLRVVGDKGTGGTERAMVGGCLGVYAGVMACSFFFFPLQVDSSLFITAVTLGIMEGSFLKDARLIRLGQGHIPTFAVILIGLLFFLNEYGIKAVRYENEALKYMLSLHAKDFNGAEKVLNRMLELKPLSSQVNLHAATFYSVFKRDLPGAKDHIDVAVQHFDGDVIAWAVWHRKGMIEYNLGSIASARKSFEKSLALYPLFEPAAAGLAQTDNILKNYVKVVVDLK